MALAVLSSANVKPDCAVAVGVSLEPVTVIDTVALAESKLPSLTLNVKLSAPA